MPGKDGAVIEKSEATFIFKDEPGRELPAYDFAERQDELSTDSLPDRLERGLVRVVGTSADSKLTSS